jgi:hypothetical protein
MGSWASVVFGTGRTALCCIASSRAGLLRRGVCPRACECGACSGSAWWIILIITPLVVVLQQRHVGLEIAVAVVPWLVLPVAFVAG